MIVVHQQLTLLLKVRVFLAVSHIKVTESPSANVNATGPYWPSWYGRPVLASRTQTFFGSSLKHSNGLRVTPTKKIGLSPFTVSWYKNGTVTISRSLFLHLLSPLTGSPTDSLQLNLPNLSLFSYLYPSISS